LSSSCRRSCKRSRIARSAADGPGVAFIGITVPFGDGGGSFGSLAEESLAEESLPAASLPAAALTSPFGFSLFSAPGAVTEPVIMSALFLSPASGAMAGRNARSIRSGGAPFGSGKLNISCAQDCFGSAGRAAPRPA